MTYAPIALFVYNRPHLTKRTLQALKANEGACHSRLYIFADGAKTNASTEELKQINQVDQICAEVEGFEKIVVIKRKKNMGLGASIIQGVSQIIHQYGRIIVLEDDLDIATGFLTFMNFCLDKYQNEERIFQISGHASSIFLPNRPFFIQRINSWGWATWSDRWKHFNPDASALVDLVQKKGIRGYNMDKDFYHLKKTVNSSNPMWAGRWNASVYIKSGLTLYPKQSFIRHIGFSTGTNFSNKYFFDLHLRHNLLKSTFDLADYKDLSIQENTWIKRILWFQFFLVRVISRLGNLFRF